MAAAVVGFHVGLRSKTDEGGESHRTGPATAGITWDSVSLRCLLLLSDCGRATGSEARCAEVINRRDRKRVFCGESHGGNIAVALS